MSLAHNVGSSELLAGLKQFVAYVQANLDGDEKGEAQIFCDRFFRAFGHEGLREAGARLEFRVKKANNTGTSFADLMWKPRCLIEMKKRGTDLSKHFRQALDYWTRAVPDRPQYVILCNFDEFWIYDFNRQVDDPVDIVALEELPERSAALSFMFPVAQEPVFQYDLEAVSRDAAAQMGGLFRTLRARGIEREDAQRFVLQCVVAMFSEDVGLLPSALFTRLLDAATSADDAYDLILGLFHQMNTPGTPKAGRYKDVAYFNGGLFAKIPDVVLQDEELQLLRDACKTNWAGVRPEIFGTLFEGSMDAGERHAQGAHFTAPVDIMRIVRPCIVEPWRARIEAAKRVEDVHQLLLDMSTFVVLDPACGSGNFLYVAYREMRRLEAAAIEKLKSLRRNKSEQGQFQYVVASNFQGIDINPFAVEVAKVTMMIATKLATDELHDSHEILPIENLDDSIRQADALHSPWPKADVIIGNPPYLGRRRIIDELGAEYASRLSGVHPAVIGVSDFVTYWFALAHDRLKPGGRAGFVATNAIRKNDSRISSLDYIVDHGGTIFEAVSSIPWSGDAQVHVSIINWIKGAYEGKRLLWMNDANLLLETDEIYSSLEPVVDVRSAVKIPENVKPKTIFQGQTPGATQGFVIDSALRDYFVEHGEGAVIYEWVNGRDLIDGQPRDYVIDIEENDLDVAMLRYPKIMKHLRETVMEGRLEAAAEQQQENDELLAANPKAKVHKHHISLAKHWWKHFYRRAEMLKAIESLDHYIAIGRVASPERKTIAVQVPVTVRPSDLVNVIALDDLYSFGVVSSSIHRLWLDRRCSTLGTALRYTSKTVWDCFPWPQNPAEANQQEIEEAAREVLEVRSHLEEAGASLEQMYAAIRTSGESSLRRAHDKLDQAVLRAYAFDTEVGLAEQILALNTSAALGTTPVRGPGRPYASMLEPVG